MLPVFIIGAGTKHLARTMKKFKRQWRELSDEHKEKISQANTGHPKSAAHRQHISKAMKEYWRDVPHRPNQDISMDEYLGKPNGENNPNSR